MRRQVLALLVLVAAAGAAWGDVIHLRDGTTREGRIVSQNDDVVVLEVAVGSAKARVTINRGDIERIEAKATEHEKLEGEYGKRLAELDRTDADAVTRLAGWCVSKKLFTQAEGLLKGLAAQDGESFVRGNLALANMEYDRKRFDIARGHLKALLDKHPRNLEAKLLVDRIEEDERAALVRLLAGVVDRFRRGDFSRALDKAESFQNLATPEQAKAVLAKTDFPDGLKFEELAAEARLHRACRFCRQGAKLCDGCQGKGIAAGDRVCLVCAGSGAVVCDRCGGTGVKFGDVPEWQLAAVVRALERRASRDGAELDKMLKTLMEKPKDDEIIEAASQAELLAQRTLRWLDELEAIGRKHPGLTTRAVQQEREDVAKRFRDVCVQLGDRFGNRSQQAWRKIEAAEAALLSQDEQVREAHADGIRALYFYGRTRPSAKEPHAPAVAPKVQTLEPLVAKLDQVIDHNTRLTKAYGLAVADLRHNNLRRALAILVELVKNASKLDLDYLSTKMTRELRGAMPDVMATCRFELGKEKGEFGETTSYERPAFVKKLLTEADAMAAQAHGNYEKMLRFRDRGRRSEVPSSVVRNAREQAKDARRWYRAVFEVPYPLSAAKRQAVDEQIDYMSKIISQCRRWYTGRRPVPAR